MTTTLRVAAALVATLAGTTALGAQQGDLARRIEATRDGEVRMEYATRDGVCGDGRGMIGMGHMFHSATVEGTGRGGNDNCRPGLARVTHPPVCTVAGHFIRLVERRDGYAEHRCRNCGHTFGFVEAA